MRVSHPRTATARDASPAATLLLALLCCGCDRRAPDEPVARAPAATDRDAAPAQAPRGGALEVAAEGPEQTPLELVYARADAGDLASEVAAFPGLEACAAALREELPTPMSEVLADIGYSGLADDGCRTLEALATRSVEACDGLAIRAARLGCRRRFAMYHGDPDVCPHEPRQGGRDPLCVAVAMRDPSMCLAASSPPERMGLCRAIVLGSERPCRVAHATATAATGCVAAARRWWSAMPPAEARGRPALPYGFEPYLEIRIAPGQGDAGDGEEHRSGLLVRGIVLREGEGVVLGGRSQPPVGDRPPLLELRLPRPSTEELPQSLEVGPMGARAWLRVEGEEPVDSTEEDVEGRVTLERFGAERGSIVEGRASLRVRPLLEGPSAWEVRFRTFVRDLVAAEEGE